MSLSVMSDNLAMIEKNSQESLTSPKLEKVTAYELRT